MCDGLPSWKIDRESDTNESVVMSCRSLAVLHVQARELRLPELLIDKK